MSKENLPSWIDYDGEDELEPEVWNANNLEKFWRAQIVLKRRAAVHLWTIKDKSLGKRVLEEYDRGDLKKMIEKWAEEAPLADLSVFPIFYSKRSEIYANVRKDSDDFGFDFA